MTTAYERLSLEGFYAELPATDAQSARAQVVQSLAAIGYAVEDRGDRVAIVGAVPFDAGRFGVEIDPGGGEPIGIAQAWTIAHALAARLGPEALVEPMFEGDVELEQVSELGREESFGGGEPTPPDDVRWHLVPSRVAEAHAWLRAHHLGIGHGVVIGHPDTGYTRHPEIWREHGGPLDLREGTNFLEAGPPEDPRTHGLLLQPEHGTATASLIVAIDGTAVPRNPGEAPSVDLLGVAPEVRVVPIRVTTSVVVLGWQSRLARAIERAVDLDCDVISISLGGLGGRRLERAVEYAEKHGVIVVAAAGNQVGFVVAPATHPLVVACAATGPDDRPWPGSSHGRAVDISAPGGSVWVAGWKDQVPIARGGSGTSFATATVAAAAALWRSAHAEELASWSPSAVPGAFRAALKKSARNVNLPRGFGAGLLDCASLVEAPLAAGLMEASPVVPERGALTRASLDSLLGAEDRSEATVAAGVAPELDVALASELALHLTLDPELRSRLRASGLPTPQLLSRASPRLRKELRKELTRDGNRSAARPPPAPGVAAPLAPLPARSDIRRDDDGAITIRIELDIVVRVEAEFDD